MKDAEASFKAQLAAAKDAAEVRHGRTAAELKRVLAELADCKSAQSAEVCAHTDRPIRRSYSTVRTSAIAPPSAYPPTTVSRGSTPSDTTA